jgi:anti-sigma regulatory factor (Ser/Thr protein kinase)
MIDNTCRGTRLRLSNAVAVTDDDLLTQSVEGVLELLTSASRLLLPAEDVESVLPVLARMLVPVWVEGCTIGLGAEEDSIRVAASVGQAPGGAGWRLEIPISGRSEGYGVMSLAGKGDAPLPLVRSLADELALRIAIAIDTAKAIAREHHVAETLQRALLPEVLPRNGSVVLDAAYRPAAGESIVGGDWYDAFELPDGRIGISIGDVAGHGLSAAVVMGEARQAVRASMYDAKSPGEVLSRANQMLRSMPMMVTALAGIFDPRTLTFTYASAGHPPPLVVLEDGLSYMLPNGDLPLGVVEDLAPAPWTFTLPPGTLLVLYTDGIVEFERDVLFGESALVRASLDEIGDLSAHPARSVQDRVFGSKQNVDDVATLTMYILPRKLDTFDCVFSAVPFAAPFVRRGLERYLTEHGVADDHRFAIITAVGEAVANAVEHAYADVPGTVNLHVRFDESVVRVHIEDSGRWRPATKEEERGRGIPLMRALMDRVEIRTDSASTQVRMQMQTA